MNKHVFVLLVMCIFLISGCAQINRDSLRYSSIKRGTEVYKVVNEDSLTAAEKHNKEAIKLYKEHLKAYRMQCFDERKEQRNNDKYQENSSENSDKKVKDDKEKGEQAKSKFPTGEKIYMISPSATSTYSGRSDMEIFWSKDFIEKIASIIKNDCKSSSDSTSELIRALSSTASVAQMRDLLTEPSFLPLLPVERTVELGCLPPPDSAVFESTANILATLKGLKLEGAEIEPAVSANLASKVVQLFEETERTLFLQYALFRLCEMSINSPAEFRNVYPVIIHDIVRRTAEMSQLVNIEREKRRQEELKLEILKIKAPDSEELYRMCIKTKLGSGISDVNKIMDECKKLK